MMTSEAVSVPRAWVLVDEPDYETLIRDYYPRIRRAALVMTGRACDADDLAQETFLQAMRSWRRYEGRSGVETWLYSILLNLRRKRQRSEVRRRSRWLKWFERQRQVSRADAPDSTVEQAEWKESLWNAVSELSPPHHETIVLRYSEGLSYEQIAEAMNCPVGTVKSRLHHGLAALEQMLDDDRPSNLTRRRATVHTTDSDR